MSVEQDPFKTLDYYQALLYWLNDHADRGIFTLNSSLQIQSWNHWLEIHTGLPAQRVISQNILQIYPDLKKRRLERFFLQALEGQVVVLSQRLHGFLIPMLPSYNYNLSPYMLQSVRISPLVSHGNIIGLLTVIEDVTERVAHEAELQHQIEALKQTEAALLSTHARLKHLLASSPAVIYTRRFYGDQAITFVSDNVVEKLGYSSQNFTENPWFWGEHIHPDDISLIETCSLQLLSKGYHTIEYRFLHQNNTYRWVRDEMRLVQNFQGTIQEVVGAWYDITDYKLADARVQEQAALLNITTDAIYVQDLDSQILFWNQAAEQLYHWKNQEILGQKSNDLLYLESRQNLETIQKNVIEKGEWRGELHQVTKENKELIVESRWTLVKDERNKPKSILVVNTDITEKKQLEAQLLRIQRMESIGTLAGGIAHDLNNLLTPILASIKLLKMDLPEDKKKRLFKIIENSTQRGVNLVKQILSFARGIEGERTLILVHDLLKEVKELVQETFPNSIEIETQIETNLWPVSGDATQLIQVLMNCCVNARDAMPKGGTLSISAKNKVIDEVMVRSNREAQVGCYIKIAISDTGTGISTEVIDRIFEPFFTTKEIGKGTGLGLSTALGIIKSHGGFMSVESQLDKGTTFKLYLPAINLDETSSDPIGIALESQEKLMLVGDNQDAV